MWFADKRPICMDHVYRGLGYKNRCVPKDATGTFPMDVFTRLGQYLGQAMVEIVPPHGNRGHRLVDLCACGQKVPLGRMAQHKCK